jgi:hypothetical protein
MHLAEKSCFHGLNSLAIREKCLSLAENSASAVSTWRAFSKSIKKLQKNFQPTFVTGLGNCYYLNEIKKLNLKCRELDWDQKVQVQNGTDFYFLKKVDDNNFKIDIDITLGDAMVCEFSLESPNKVNVIEYTSWGSKADPSNTVFALQDESLKKFVNFINLFDGFSLDVSDFKFLDKYDNYNPK